MSNTTNKIKLVKAIILDASGHTELTQPVQDAVDMIVKQVKEQNKWVFVNGSPFIFQNVEDPREQTLLYNQLNDAENPEYQLTGSLRGGARKLKAAKKSNTLYRSRTINKPVSTFFNTRNRPQLAVVIKQNHGKTVVDVVTSSYKKADKRVAKHANRILEMINALV